MGELSHSAVPVVVKPDFSGWATKANLKCSDGRTILPGAFAHQDKTQVPLVWQHGHNDPGNVLGHAVLENRTDGVYAQAYFNDTEQAKTARTLIQHNDINALSIFANQLVEKAKQVSHGVIRELSLVLSGANPGALIDNVELQHADGETVTLTDEAIIYTGESLADEESAEETEQVTEDDDDATVQDVYDEMSDQQKEVVHYMVGAALESSATSENPGITHSSSDSEKEVRKMSRNVFEQQNSGNESNGNGNPTLSHDDMRGIVADATRIGSLKEAVENYALKHGIEDIDTLFPDAKNLTQRPEFDSRRVEWVQGVLNGTRHSPFSRIKTMSADITVESARALGYIKGNLKKEEFFGLQKRVTTPTTVYKKQKLDRDDIIDISDFDVVAWMKGEMRLMLDEELARAILIGDGRAVDNEDKIRDPAGTPEGAGIRSIVNDHELYVATVEVDLGADANVAEAVDAVISSLALYKGTGTPTMYTTLSQVTRFLLSKDTIGRRLYRSSSELAGELGVSSIVPVEVLETDPTIVGIIVNLADYTVGTDAGGNVSLFDDFDIDYNQYKYLIETRLSGALTKIRSAIVVRNTGTTGP
jgi:hypothetical protein